MAMAGCLGALGVAMVRHHSCPVVESLPMTLRQKLYARPTLLLVLTTLFWAGNAVASKFAVGNVSPMMIVFIRWSLVAALMLFLNFNQVRQHWGSIRPQLKVIALMAALGFTLFNALLYEAAHMTSVVNIGILQGSIPMMVMIGALILFGTPVTLLQFGGILLTMTGVLAVASNGELANIANLQINGGDGLMLLACLFYTFYTLALRNRPKVPGLVFFTVTSTVAALVSLPLVFVEYAAGELVMPNATGLITCLYIALFPSFLSQVFFMRGVELIGPARAGVFVNLIPVFSSILAVLLLSESFELFHGLALALVLGGIWISERAARRTAATGKAT
ncbi:DMT family transporter [Polycladidibacter hongkongensis]|uniref:DMT family transporter n=1 Tax=Polycladidibacter hongkongensis TaxID=1647556 RepID=UPI000A5E222E|nr:DMT family transporter [Pseudovibrio hongkongensis]